MCVGRERRRRRKKREVKKKRRKRKKKEKREKEKKGGKKKEGTGGIRDVGRKPGVASTRSDTHEKQGEEGKFKR
jgi:hypothetical protein